MKKWLSVLLAAAVLTAAFVTTASAYDDVAEDEYYAEAIDKLGELGIMYGYECNSFKPKWKVTRVEMVALVCRITDETAQKANDAAHNAEGATKFDDVGEDNWACGYINLAVDKGFISGDGDGNFRPNDDVTYEEAIKMIVCAVGLADDTEINADNWSEEYISIAEENKITSDFTFEKDAVVTRGDAAFMLYKGLIIR